MIAMNPGMRTLLACALATLAAARSTLAQEPAAPEPVAARYQVELVVFRHLDQRGNTPEAPLPVSTVAADAIAAALPATGLPAQDGTALWPALAPADLQLAGIAARLRQPGAYQLIYHGGWLQPLEGQRHAAPTPLPAEAGRAGLLGAITLYRERYPHALVDVSLGTAASEPATSGATDSRARIRQGRRLRGSAPQYFDHPQFGLILSVRALGGSGENAPAEGSGQEESSPAP